MHNIVDLVLYVNAYGGGKVNSQVAVRAYVAAPKLKPDKAAPAKAKGAKTFFTDDGHDPATWKTSDEQQQQPYRHAAEMDKLQYAKQMAAYTPSPGWLGAKAFVEADRLAREAANTRHCVRCCEDFKVVRPALC